MQKFKEIIRQHGRWRDLEILIDRILTHVETDFSVSLENSKALLESICKEICKQKGLQLSETSSINVVLKTAFTALGYSNQALVTQISSALATIAQQMGNLRNEIGLTAHGMSLEELRERNNRVDVYTRELLVDTTEIVASFLVRGFEAKNPIKLSVDAGPQYRDNGEFNDFWDESFGEFTMGAYAFTASEILYHLDKKAYETEYKAFEAEEM